MNRIHERCQSTTVVFGTCMLGLWFHRRARWKWDLLHRAKNSLAHHTCAWSIRTMPMSVSACKCCIGHGIIILFWDMLYCPYHETVILNQNVILMSRQVLNYECIQISYLNNQRLLVAKALTQPVWPFSLTFLSAAFSLKSQVTTDFAAMPQKIVRLAVSWDGGSWTRENAGDPSGVMRVFSTTLLGSSPSVACMSHRDTHNRESSRKIWKGKSKQTKKRFFQFPQKNSFTALYVSCELLIYDFRLQWCVQLCV